MGLDMYLKGSVYLSEYDHRTNKIKEQVSEILSSQYGRSLDVSHVSVQVGYWRKANAIHRWFVQNVQNGVDDCNTYYVSREKLLELKKLCQEALLNPGGASNILSTQSGFFFGSVEYDEGYFEDLENTIDIINDALKLPDEWSLEYHSSW